MVSLSMNIPKSSPCNNVFTYLTLRQEFGSVKLSETTSEQCSATHLPEAIKENELAFGELDKIFAAQWLDEYHMICGTKCNNVSRYVLSPFVSKMCRITCNLLIFMIFNIC